MSLFLHRHASLCGVKRTSGGCGNNAEGDVSFDNRFKVELKASKAWALESASFFLTRVDRKAFGFVLH